MSLPSMLGDFVFPESYVVFLNKISFVNVDFMSIVGAQCVIDVDFRFSVLVSLCIPLAILLVVLISYQLDLLKINGITERMSLKNKEELIGDLFDLSDEDMSGVIDEHEFVDMVEFIAPKKVVRLVKKMSQTEVRQIMLLAGARISTDGALNQIVPTMETSNELKRNTALRLQARIKLKDSKVLQEIPAFKMLKQEELNVIIDAMDHIVRYVNTKVKKRHANGALHWMFLLLFSFF